MAELEERLRKRAMTQTLKERLIKALWKERNRLNSEGEPTIEYDAALLYLEGGQIPSGTVIEDHKLLNCAINDVPELCWFIRPYSGENIKGIKFSDGLYSGYTVEVKSETDAEVVWKEKDKTERGHYFVRDVVNYLNKGTWTELENMPTEIIELTRIIEKPFLPESV